MTTVNAHDIWSLLKVVFGMDSLLFKFTSFKMLNTVSGRSQNTERHQGTGGSDYPDIDYRNISETFINTVMRAARLNMTDRLPYPKENHNGSGSGFGPRNLSGLNCSGLLYREELYKMAL